MNLPDRFQMRVSKMPGFTNTVKQNAHGDYEVKWARGYPEALGGIPNKVFDKSTVIWCVDDGYWLIVEDTPKAEAKQAQAKQPEGSALPDSSASLPDVFYFTGEYFERAWYKAVKRHGEYRVTWEGDDVGTTYSFSKVEKFVCSGDWKIIDRKPLTPEQIRANKDFREQIAQLEQSIKIQQQTISHHERCIDNCNAVIGNYDERIVTLKSKIVEEV